MVQSMILYVSVAFIGSIIVDLKVGGETTTIVD